MEVISRRLRDQIVEVEDEARLANVEWAEFSADLHDPGEYRRAAAVHERNSYERYTRKRSLLGRRAQIVEAMKGQIGSEFGADARNLVKKLVWRIHKHEQGSLPTEVLHKVLDDSWIVAQGSRKTLREFVESGTEW